MIFQSKSLLIGVLSTLLAMLVEIAFPVFLNVTDFDVLEISKCPACFGLTMCPQFSTEKISIETWSRVSTTVFLNSKNVYFAQYAGKRVSTITNHKLNYLVN